MSKGSWAEETKGVLRLYERGVLTPIEIYGWVVSNAYEASPQGVNVPCLNAVMAELSPELRTGLQEWGREYLVMDLPSGWEDLDPDEERDKLNASIARAIVFWPEAGEDPGT